MQQHAVWFRRVSCSILLASVLSACQSGGDSSANSHDPVALAAGTPTFAEGYVIKGPVSSSKVVVYALDPTTGNRTGVVVGPFYTDTDGHWSGMVPSSDVPYEVVSTGGVYLDEATQQTVVRAADNEKDSISGILDFNKLPLAVTTPLSTVALQAAKQRAKTFHEPIAQAMDVVLFDLELTFGFDVATTIPSFTGAEGSVDVSSEQRYAALLGGFSKLADSTQYAALNVSAPVYEIRNALIKELSDGKFNGKDAASNAITVVHTDGTVSQLPVLSSDNMSVYLQAVNSYAQTQSYLSTWSINEQIPLVFNSDGGRLLVGELQIAAPKNTFLAFVAAGGENVYRQEATLRLDENNEIVDELGNTMLLYFKNPNDSTSNIIRSLPIDAAVYWVNTVDVRAAGFVSAINQQTGVKVDLGQVALAQFLHSEALEEVSPGVWRESASSGAVAFIKPVSDDAIGEIRVQ